MFVGKANGLYCKYITIVFYDHHERRLNYRWVLTFASVVNYDRKHDATTWSVTYLQLASLTGDPRHLLMILCVTY
jgi:hypothetical protein